MAKLLLMEGNPADRRTRATALGVRQSSEIYAEAIAAEFPDIALDVLLGADRGVNTPDWADYAGLVVTGSSLHAYDRDFAITNQIALIRQAAEHGLAIFGSCWGLQIAVMAAGGEVGLSPNGREVGFARKIALTAEGIGHPMFGGKCAGPPVFDAPCIHYDAVTRLPAGATCLAANAHSAVQAAVVPLGRSEVWGVQYHPEFDLRQVAELYRLYANNMIAEGFFADMATLEAATDQLLALAANPADAGLAWQLGLDADVLDDRRRRAEIIAWVETKVLPAA